MTETTQQQLDRIPPQALEAEQAMLGAMLLDQRAIAAAGAVLHQEDFYREAHRTIYAGITSLYQKREAVDLITLGNWLKDHDQLEAVGGTLYLTTIMTNTPTAAGAAHYAEIIRAKAMQRAIIRAGDAIMEVGYRGGDDPAALLSTAGQQLDAISHTYQAAATDTRKFSDLLQEVFTDQDKAITDGQSVGIKTGWKGLNQKLSSALPKQLIVVAARPKQGKTAFMLNLAETWAGWDLPGAIYSMEMASKQLAIRALLREMHFTEDDLGDIEYCRENPEVMREMAQSVERLWNLPIMFNDRPGLTLAELDASLRELKHTAGIKWAMVDYLQLAQTGQRNSNRTTEVNAIANGLKHLAKTHDIPIVVLTQLSREVEREHPYRPQAHHCYEGGGIEAAADALLYIYRPGFYGEEDVRAAGFNPELHQHVVEIGILMQRRGRSGTRAYLAFDGAHYSFRDLYADEWQSLAQQDTAKENDRRPDDQEETAYQKLGGLR